MNVKDVPGHKVAKQTSVYMSVLRLIYPLTNQREIKTMHYRLAFWKT